MDPTRAAGRRRRAVRERSAGSVPIGSRRGGGTGWSARPRLSRGTAYNAWMVGSSLRIAVLFGGPSPEHDVSILTGLQAAHALSQESVVGAVHALYWTKTGSWLAVSPNSLEARAFADGPPDGGRRVELRRDPEGDSSPAVARHGAKAQTLEIDVAIVCCHGGPGEDGSLQGILDCAHVAYSGPGARRGGARHGQARDGRGPRGRRDADTAAAGARRGGHWAGVPRSLHRQAALRRLLDRHRRRAGLADGSGPPAGQRPSPAGRGRGALPG